MNNEDKPVAWRVFDSAFWSNGSPDQKTIDYWKQQGVEIEYAYTHPAPKADEAADWVDTLTRAADMLDAYFQLMHEKVRWDELERWHYMPEVGEFAEKLRSLAASPARVGEGEK